MPIPKFSIPTDGAFHKVQNDGADLTDGAYVIEPEGGAVRYVIATDTPAGTDSAFLLREGDWRPVEIETGEDIWVLAIGRAVLLNIGA